MSESFWTSEAGFLLRLDMLSQDIVWRTINNSIQLIGGEAGVREFEWVTEYLDNEPCNYCDSQSGRRYRVGQFIPRIPAHTNCKCHWSMRLELD
ncbi:hypothetical protein MUP38_04370 [Candidatus Bathyarchaeota archaeon]|nr:hypothetical protein [Candidatus Bathyarchaeota archaeon]